MVQFIKGPWKSGEDNIEIKPKEDPSTSPSAVSSGPNCSGLGNFKLVKMGRGFVGIMGDKLPLEEHEKAAEDALTYAQKETESGRWDIVILDEINNAVSLGLITKEKVLDLLKLITNNSLQVISHQLGMFICLTAPLSLSSA